MDESEFDGQYLTYLLTDKAVDFIADESDQPFFLFASYNAPHFPAQAPQDLIDKYSDVEDENRRVYLAMLDAVDQGVGDMLQALDNAGKRDNTLVFLLSDNGGPFTTGTDNTPLRGEKGNLYEGGIRLPFIAAWPDRWPAGATYDSQVISLDIGATALDLAGLTPDEDKPLDGVSLDPFVLGEAEGMPHETLFWRRYKGNPHYFILAARTNQYKLYRDKGKLNFFDLVNDVGETTDLSRDPDYYDEAERLVGLWNEWNRDVNVPTMFLTGDAYLDAFREHGSEALPMFWEWQLANTPDFQQTWPHAQLWRIPETFVAGVPKTFIMTTVLPDTPGLWVGVNYDGNNNLTTGSCPAGGNTGANIAHGETITIRGCYEGPAEIRIYQGQQILKSYDVTVTSSGFTASLSPAPSSIVAGGSQTFTLSTNVSDFVWVGVNYGGNNHLSTGTCPAGGNTGGIVQGGSSVKIYGCSVGDAEVRIYKGQLILNSYPVSVNGEAENASLSSVPSSMSVGDSQTFTLSTNVGDGVWVGVNYDGANHLSTGSCPAGGNTGVTLTNGQSVTISGCSTGTAEIRLYKLNTLLATYEVTVSP